MAELRLQNPSHRWMWNRDYCGARNIKRELWINGNMSCFLMNQLSHYSPPRDRFTCGEPSAEAYNPDCLLPRVKHGCGSVMVWAMISWFAAGPIITDGSIAVTMSLFWSTIFIQWRRHRFRQGIAPFRMIMPRFTEVELFNHALRNMRIKLHTFPGLHNHRT